MNELELLLLRLEDISEASENKDAKILAKALKRYFDSINKNEIGFTHEAKRTRK